MKPVDLIEGLRDYLGMSQLEPDSKGAYTIVFDEGLDVEFLALNDKLLLVRSTVADVPEEEDECESFFRNLLHHNLLFLREQTATLSLEDDAAVVWLARTVVAAQQDVTDFCELVEDFVNTLQWWRSITPQSSAVSSTQVEWLPLNMLRP